MKLFPTTRAKRTIASLMLVVWLFALVSGVANACLLDAGEGHRQDEPALSHASHGHVGMAAHEAHGDDPDDETDASKAPCLKVCDEGAHSLPSVGSALDLTDPGIPCLVAVLWVPDAQSIPVPHYRSWEQPLPPDLPVRTRYSRLAI